MHTFEKLTVLLALVASGIVAMASQPPMQSHYFLYRLTPPRPTFAQDMTPSETKLMQEHVAYWRALVEQHHVLVFGPVADPAGGYGIAIITVGSEAEAHSFATNDPAIKAGVGFRFDLFAMPRAIATPKA